MEDSRIVELYWQKNADAIKETDSKYGAWHTAPVGENGETNHSGFNIYIRYDCPLA